ncbi:MAG: hypothetical protein ACOC44_11385 [Promethearchaeia archaeon]
MCETKFTMVLLRLRILTPCWDSCCWVRLYANWDLTSQETSKPF